MSLLDLPLIYRRFLPKPLRISKESPAKLQLTEKKATCFSCAMAPKDSANPPADRSKWYHPQLRCCTYHPFIANFLVGQALSEESSQVAAEMREQIQNRQFCLPIGLVPSPKFQVSFNHREEDDFGHMAEWLCPFLNREDLSCRVWSARGSVCSTYYCKSSYGKKGLLFWQNLGQYLAIMEMCLLEEALSLHGFSPREQNASLEYLNMQTCTPELWKAETLPKKIEKELWRDWIDEKEKFYILCYQWMKKLTRAEFIALLPNELKEMENDLLSQYEEIVKISDRGIQ